MSRPVDEQHRSALLERIVDYVHAHGVSELSLRPLAKAVKSSPRVLLYYFKSKEDVLRSVFRETWRALIATIQSVEESDDSPREQLRKVAEILLRSWKRDPDLVRVLVLRRVHVNVRRAGCCRVQRGNSSKMGI